jgi:hypothetical protein
VRTPHDENLTNMTNVLRSGPRLLPLAYSRSPTPIQWCRVAST